MRSPRPVRWIRDARSRFAAPHGVLVRGDAGRLRQAVDNLLRNAVVHTPAGSAVEVKVEVTDGRGPLERRATTGPGSTPEEAEHVFDRFFQADPSRSGQGTGLGLSIVAAIAEAHGGRTWVQSVKGAGSTFHFELPVDDQDEDAVDLRNGIGHPEPEPAQGQQRVEHRVGR